MEKKTLVFTKVILNSRTFVLHPLSEEFNVGARKLVTMDPPSHLEPGVSIARIIHIVPHLPPSHLCIQPLTTLSCLQLVKVYLGF